MFVFKFSSSPEIMSMVFVKNNVYFLCFQSTPSEYGLIRPQPLIIIIVVN